MHTPPIVDFVLARSIKPCPEELSGLKGSSPRFSTRSCGMAVIGSSCVDPPLRIGSATPAGIGREQRPDLLEFVRFLQLGSAVMP